MSVLINNYEIEVIEKNCNAKNQIHPKTIKNTTIIGIRSKKEGNRIMSSQNLAKSRSPGTQEMTVRQKFLIEAYEMSAK